MVSTFARRSWITSERQPPEPAEDGWTDWNGTSFSTAIVTGMIAAEMARKGISARDAWQNLRLSGVQAPGGGNSSGFLPFVIPEQQRNQ